MQPDDEIVLGRALDESRSGLRQMRWLRNALGGDGVGRSDLSAELNRGASEIRASLVDVAPACRLVSG